jgi:hypothetical protein
MDIAQIAITAAALLAPYLVKAGEAAAKKAGETAWEKVESLYQAMRGKFAADEDDYAEKTLQRLEEQPTSEVRQASLADILTEKAEADPTFARELAQLVQDTAQDQATAQFLTQVYDNARVDKIINIGQAGTVRFD